MYTRYLHWFKALNGKKFKHKVHEEHLNGKVTTSTNVIISMMVLADIN